MNLFPQGGAPCRLQRRRNNAAECRVESSKRAYCSPPALSAPLAPPRAPARAGFFAEGTGAAERLTIRDMLGTQLGWNSGFARTATKAPHGLTKASRQPRLSSESPFWSCFTMVDRIAKLEAALRVNAALLVRAQRLIVAYTAPESDRADIISELVRLLDGPAQREADRLAAEALSEARGVEEKDPALTLQIRNLPPRFWAQVVVGGTTGFLYVATPFRPDWIEAICGRCHLDQHDGSIEWIIVMAMLVLTLAILGGLSWVKDRQ
jgi:hypothetical protein